MGLGLFKSVIVKPEEQKFLKDDLLLKWEKIIRKRSYWILENIEINEETKIIKGSQIDLDFNDPEKYEIDEKEGLIPKREKQSIEEDFKLSDKPKYIIKSNTNVNEAKDDNDFQSNYEAVMLKNIAYQIEFIFKNEPEKVGMVN